MTNTHSTLVDTELHVPGYVQSADPGAVGAGIGWIDTSGGTGSWVWKIRNAADDGWETAGGGGSSGAPTDATYITQTPNATLTNEQALNALSDGLLKHVSGVAAQAVAETDYVTPSGSGTLANKTLTTPTIADFTNAGHDHADAAGGGQLNAGSVFNTGSLPHERGGLEADVSAYTGAPRINAGATSDLGTGTTAQFLRGDYTWQTPSSGGLEPESYWGGNLVKNYPSLERADGAQPEWWEESGSGTLTEEDATGETIAQKYERVLKFVVSGGGGGADYLYQRFVHADENVLDDSVTPVSLGCWVYTASAGTITLQAYNVGGSASLGTDTTTTTGSWVWLEITNVTIGTTSTDLRISHSANSATFYVAMPTLNVGATVRPWQARGLRYVEDYAADILLKTPPTNTTYNDFDNSANTSPLAVAFHLGMFLETNASGAAVGYIRRNGSTDATGAPAVHSIPASDRSISTDPFVLCDDRQIIEEKVNDNTRISQWSFSQRGYWEWE